MLDYSLSSLPLCPLRLLRFEIVDWEEMTIMVSLLATIAFLGRTGINLRLGIGDVRLLSVFSSSVPSAPRR
jgi:hypothetical protein